MSSTTDYTDQFNNKRENQQKRSYILENESELMEQGVWSVAPLHQTCVVKKEKRGKKKNKNNQLRILWKKMMFKSKNMKKVLTK